MMATYRDGHFFCEEHGDLGEHDEAIANETVLYSGEDQLDGFFCMACLGEEATMDREIEEHEKEFTEGDSTQPGPLKQPPRLW